MSNDIKEFSFSRHATARILDMQLDAREVRLTLQSPEAVVQSTKYPQCDMYRRGRITISVERASKHVATVLWTSDRDWVKDIEGKGSYGTRQKALRRGFK